MIRIFDAVLFMSSIDSLLLRGMVLCSRTSRDFGVVSPLTTTSLASRFAFFGLDITLLFLVVVLLLSYPLPR